MYLRKSLSDGKVGERPSAKKYAITVGIVAIVGMVITLGYLVLSDVKELDNEKMCQDLLDEGKKLTIRNDNITDVSIWDEEDEKRIYEIEDLYRDKCIPKKEEILGKLQECTILYITIQSLIDKMDKEDGGFKLNSLPKHEQDVYNDSYASYFGNRCNQIIDEIEQTDKSVKKGMFQWFSRSQFSNLEARRTQDSQACSRGLE